MSQQLSHKDRTIFSVYDVIREKKSPCENRIHVKKNLHVKIESTCVR